MLMDVLVRTRIRFALSVLAGAAAVLAAPRAEASRSREKPSGAATLPNGVRVVASVAFISEVSRAGTYQL